MWLPIFVFLKALKLDIFALCFWFLLIKMGRCFWLQVPHMLRKDTGRMRSKSKHFAPAGTNRQGVRQASRPQSQDPSLAASALMKSSPGSEHWQWERLSWDLACVWLSSWHAVVQNTPISTLHSSWFLSTAKGRSQEEIPCWGNIVGYRGTGEQSKKWGHWLTPQRRRACRKFFIDFGLS